MLREDFPDELVDLFTAEANVMSARLERSRVKHDHGTLRGNISERVVQTFLQDYLPSEYGYANGEIMDREWSRSKEVDIAICSNAHPFTYGRDGSGILFKEGISSVIESKSTLKESQLESAIENCESVRDLETKAPANSVVMSTDSDGLDEEELGYVPYFLFAFRSDYSLRSLRRKLEDTNEEIGITGDERIDVVIVLDRGVIFRNSPGDNIEIDPESSDYEIESDLPPLLMFIFLLYDKMYRMMLGGNALAGYLTEQSGDE